MTIAPTVTTSEPRNSGKNAEQVKGGVPQTADQLGRVNLKESGDAFAQEERKDQDDEEDGREPAHADDRFDGRLAPLVETLCPACGGPRRRSCYLHSVFTRYRPPSGTKPSWATIRCPSAPMTSPDMRAARRPAARPCT